MISYLKRIGILRFVWDVIDFLMPSIIKTIYFNFHYLPFSQARKLPIKLRCCSIKRQLGEVIIDSPNVRYGMIEIGHRMNLWCPNHKCILNLRGGKIVFKGNCFWGPGSCISVGKKGLLELGDGTTFASSTMLEVWKKVVFGYNVHVGWGCTVIDTDFHPLFDLAAQSYAKICSPVIIGECSWIGANTFVKKGTHLAPNTIVSAASVVQGRFKEENCVICGNPANVIDKGYCIKEETFFNYQSFV